MKKFTVVAFTLALALALSACGSKSKETASGAEEGEAVKKVIVGTGNDFEQVAFLDDKGNLTGFDVELIREIDKRLKDYEFEFQSMEFSNILLSLETKKVDIAAHLFEKNPERTEKFDFNQEPYAYWRNKIIVASDNTDPIKSLDDLKGKKVLIGPTSAQAQILENYNKEHEDAKIDIVYQQNDANDEVQQISSGRVYATLGADFLLPLKDPQGKLKTVGDPLNEGNILYVFRKNDPESKKLSDAVDATIKELKADGTLKKISEQWLKQDFSK
ncbi:extracellular solute-binding protein family 3 [Paenibacillus curdlanolyticus YK9]|uniref:Extracellular solute-binding protein family 3 n=1 Tax=Paenibacillus curdlanolyticus YK9 TaxID=717606 RepID=E0IE55_9BACL|nr:transporter substrate-binding domain-containing protein [Paenibacillus curdlanolyticus]EFM09409.1 extracellular solute-binding protein family 3 [Paenibacillus curdlanolyticus YK9]